MVCTDNKVRKGLFYKRLCRRRVPEGGRASEFLLPLCLPSPMDDPARPLLQSGHQRLQDGETVALLVLVDALVTIAFVA